MYEQDFWQGDSSYANYVGDKAGAQRNFRRRIKTLRAFSPGGRLYEAGCAHGFFLEIAREYWEVEGSDISAEAVAYAQKTLNLPVTLADYESSPLPPERYDVIAMWDTIEHLYDPILSIQQSTAALKPGGILALTTGDVDAVLPRLQKKSWRLIHPTHLYYFSRQSMTRLLQTFGMEVVHFSYVGNWRSFRQMAHVLTFGRTQQNWRNRVVRLLEKLPFIDVEIPVNTYDVMFVIGRKLEHGQG